MRILIVLMVISVELLILLLIPEASSLVLPLWTSPGILRLVTT